MPLRLTGLGSNATDEDAYQDDLRLDERNAQPVKIIKRTLGTCKECKTFGDLVIDDAICRDCAEQIQANCEQLHD